MASGGALGTARYFMNLEGGRINQILDRNRRRRERKMRRIASQEQRREEQLSEIEDCLGRIFLLAMSAQKVLVGKRVIGRDDIIRTARQIEKRGDKCG